MQFVNQDADVFIPDGADLPTAMARTKILIIGAHQDDQPIMAMHGIGKGLGQVGQIVTGVIVTNGGGSARGGPYQNYTDDQMIAIRHIEQQTEARDGRYSAQFQLMYKSSDIKGANAPKRHELVQELYDILMAAKPESVYLHNPYDFHLSHQAASHTALIALRMMPKDAQPKQVYGCQVWGSLDWADPGKRVGLDISPWAAEQEKLIGCHDSQIQGGKNYIKGTLGGEFHDATYYDPYKIDEIPMLTNALDLKPLLDDPQLDLEVWKARIHRTQPSLTNALIL